MLANEDAIFCDFPGREPRRRVFSHQGSIIYTTVLLLFQPPPATDFGQDFFPTQVCITPEEEIRCIFDEIYDDK